MSDLNISLSLPKFTSGKADVVSALPVNTEHVNDNKNEKEVNELPAKEVNDVIEEVNAFMQSMQRNLSFRVDEDLGEPIISVMDIETDEVIRQIPSEELLVIRKKMDDVNGTLFDDEV